MASAQPRYTFRFDDLLLIRNTALKPARLPAPLFRALRLVPPAQGTPKPAAGGPGVPLNAFTPDRIATGLSYGLNSEASRGTHL